MRRIMYNRYEQLRSGWKIAMIMGAFFIISLILAMIFAISLVIVAAEFRDKVGTNIFSNLGNIMQTNYSLFAIVTIMQEITFMLGAMILWKSLEKRPFREMGMSSLRKGFKDLFKGLVLGILAVSAVLALLLATGNVTIQMGVYNPKLTSNLIYCFAMFAFVGLSEEIFARGYCMTVLKQTGNRWVVVIVSSVVFSLMHLVNPFVTALGLFNIFLIGVLLAYMVFKTGSLWMPIGFHITWDFMLQNVYGFTAGEVQSQGYDLFSTRYVTENIFNGGKYPQGGIAVSLVMLIFILFVWKMVRNRNNYWTAGKPQNEVIPAYITLQVASDFTEPPAAVAPDNNTYLPENNNE